MWDWGGGELASVTAVAEPSAAYRESYTPSVDRYQVNVEFRHYSRNRTCNARLYLLYSCIVDNH